MCPEENGDSLSLLEDSFVSSMLLLLAIQFISNISAQHTFRPHFTVSHYGCARVCMYKLCFCMLMPLVFFLPQPRLLPSPPPSPLPSPYATSSNTQLRTLSMCRQERVSNMGGGAEKASLAALVLVQQPMLCQDRKKSAFLILVVSLPSETLL